VEDEENIRTPAVEILEARGYTVLSAGDAAEALAVAERHSGRIHLMITDVVMPGMSGSQLAERLLALHPDLRIVYISGIAVVQDPEEADYPSMPASALRNVAVDHVLSIAEIGPLLDRLTRESFPDAPESALAAESGDDRGREPAYENDKEGGIPSGFTCPECGSALFERCFGNGPIHFRCRTGHAYSAESLVAKQATGVEAALWAAVRALEERAALARRIERRMQEAGRAVSMERFTERAQRAERHAELLRGVLFDAAADPAAD